MKQQEQTRAILLATVIKELFRLQSETGLEETPRWALQTTYSEETQSMKTLQKRSLNHLIWIYLRDKTACLCDAKNPTKQVGLSRLTVLYSLRTSFWPEVTLLSKRVLWLLRTYPRGRTTQRRFKKKQQLMNMTIRTILQPSCPQKLTMNRKQLRQSWQSWELRSRYLTCHQSTQRWLMRVKFTRWFSILTRLLFTTNAMMKMVTITWSDQVPSGSSKS